MSLPLLSGREIVKALGRAGYAVDHQRGSHIVLRHGEPPNRRVTIPDHKEVARGTLRSILRSTGLTEEQFRELL
jgi:predicted RNA binding protein YcfA (HicA-like mRNA interferase family)